MRRLLCLSAGLFLMLGMLGCAGQAPAAKAADSGAPADQGTKADTPTEDISAPEEDKSSTPLNLHGAKGGDLEDRTSSAEEASTEARATPTNPDETGPAPSLDQVQSYLSNILYPGSTFVTGKGPESNGKVIIAMTQVNTPASNVRTHFEGKGAKTIDTRSESGGVTVTMELIDHPRGMSVAIAISQLGSASGSCLVNYSAHPIPTGPAPEDEQPMPAMPGNG